MSTTAGGIYDVPYNPNNPSLTGAAYIPPMTIGFAAATSLSAFNQPISEDRIREIIREEIRNALDQWGLAP